MSGNVCTYCVLHGSKLDIFTYLGTYLSIYLNVGGRRYRSTYLTKVTEDEIEFSFFVLKGKEKKIEEDLHSWITQIGRYLNK